MDALLAHELRWYERNAGALILNQNQDGTDAEAISAVLVGRRIVEAEVTDEDKTEGLLRLDDGTELRIVTNSGCGGCNNGWYQIEQIVTTDNVITNARMIEDDGSDRYGIHVVTDGGESDALVVSAEIDNGCYGYGYWIEVRANGS